MANPVASATSSARAWRAPAAPAAAARRSVSTLSAPDIRATTTRPSATNTSDLTIWANSQPTAVAASRAVRVPVG